MEPTTENFDEILKKLLSAIPGVNAAVIVSTEGLPIISVNPQSFDEIRIAAMTAVLYSLAKKFVIEMKRGKFDQLYIKGIDGYLLVLEVSPNAVLILSTTKDVRLGKIFYYFDNYGPPFPFNKPSSPGATGSATKKVPDVDE